MNVEDQIIALLNGDLTDDAEAERLMRELAGSSEQRRMLLEHTVAARQLRSMGKRSVPTSAAVAGVLGRVAEYESTQRKGKPADATPHSSAARRLLGWGIMFILGFLLGCLLFAFPSSEGQKNGKAFPSGSNNSGGTTLHGGGSADGSVNTGDELFGRIVDSNRSPGGSNGPISDSIGNPPQRLDRGRMPTNSPSDTAGPLPPALASPLPLTGELQVLSPNGGEVFSTGDVIPILWSGVAKNQKVSVEISGNSGKSWQAIGKDVAGNRMLWSVPQNIATGSHYLLRIGTKDLGSSDPRLDTSFSTGSHSVDALDISPDGKILALGVGNDVILRDLTTQSEIGRLTGHTDDVYHVDFNADGSKLVSASRDGTAVIWNMADRRVEHRLSPDQGYMWQASFSPDGKKVATVSSNDVGIIFWDVATGERGETFSNIHTRTIRFFQYTADGTRILTTSIDRSVAISDARTGDVLLRVVHHIGSDFGRETIVHGAQLTPDDSILITCGYDGWVKFWDAHTGLLKGEKIYHNGEYALALLLSRDGKFVVSVGYDGTAKLIDPYTEEVLAEATLNNGPSISRLIQGVLSPGDHLLALGHLDGQVSCWNLGDIPQQDLSDNFWTILQCDDGVGVEDGNIDSDKKTQMNLQ